MWWTFQLFNGLNFSPPSGARRHGGGRAAGCGRLVMELELLASPLATFKIDGNIMSTIHWRRVLKLYFLEVELQAMNPLRRRGGCGTLAHVRAARLSWLQLARGRGAEK